MARPKKLSDGDVLEAALRIAQGRGPDHLTFAAVSEACGLSPATLVQRFGTRDGLLQAALLRAWDRLDDLTAQAAATAALTPEGAVALLVGLSADYGGIETYAEGLMVLREDFRDPTLRARGAAWKRALSGAIEACFAGTPSAPAGVGLLMISQWQGCLVWWAFEPDGPVDRYVERQLRAFCRVIQGGAGGSLSRG